MKSNEYEFPRSEFYLSSFEWGLFAKNFYHQSLILPKD